MQQIDTPFLASKFRGTLLGALAGDCCGQPFEEYTFKFETVTSDVSSYLNRLETEETPKKLEKYSDDTAMTKVLAAALLSPTYSQRELAENFTNEYFEQPFRTYGAHVIDVFRKLRNINYSDPTGPARKQFDGEGSFGNGGAMRISPVALYCWNNLEELFRLSLEVTEITHTHDLGVNGAILQALAIQKVLNLDPTKDIIIINDFIQDLINQMKFFEGIVEMSEDQASHDFPNQTKNCWQDDVKGVGYQIQLKKVKELLDKDDPTLEEVVANLGNTLEALYSVPTAIYCFLRSQKPNIKNSGTHPFRSTLEFALKLKGDADTIGSMSCAIAGAFYGDTVISSNLIKHLEANDVLTNLANELFNKVGPK